MSKRENKGADVSGEAPAGAAPSAEAAVANVALDGPAPASSEGHPWLDAVRIWASAYRVELILFVVSYAVLAFFSSQRFFRQSEAPHFVWQAKAWLDGRLDLDPDTLPESRAPKGVPVPTVVGRTPVFEDWACVREVNGVKKPCEDAQRRPLPVLATDKWYSSFPWFPAVAMLPFVAIHGYQFNDTSFGVFIGALAVAFFYSLLRHLSQLGESERSRNENIALALLLGFGTVFFYCAIRGEVWFLAEVMGVALTCLYARNAIGARRPLLAGLFFSMAVLTRTPLLFAGVLFLIEVFLPGPNRLEQLRTLHQRLGPALRKLALFLAGAAPLALFAAWYNHVRFGRITEFGHAFLYWNRVNHDIERYGLFNPVYLPRNLEAAFLKLPGISLDPPSLTYDPHGLTLLLTLPVLALIFFAPKRRWASWPFLLALPLLVLIVSPELLRRNGWVAWLLLFSLVAMAYFGQPESPKRLHWPLWLTVGACALPGLFYQNTGYMQFGFRFSLDYTPYLLLLFAISGWSLKKWWVQAVAGLGVVVNVWGAAAFKGFTEMMRNW